MDARPLPAVCDAEERALGEGSTSARLTHLSLGSGKVTGALLGDDDGGLHLGDRALLLDERGLGSGAQRRGRG